MIRRPPRSTRTDTRFPYTTLFRSDGVVVGEARREFLLVVGVTQPEGEIELVGDMEDIVREQRPILAVLAIDVVDAAKVAEPVERIEPREDVGTRRAAGTSDRRRADDGGDAGQLGSASCRGRGWSSGVMSGG